MGSLETARKEAREMIAEREQRQLKTPNAPLTPEKPLGPVYLDAATNLAREEQQARDHCCFNPDPVPVEIVGPVDDLYPEITHRPET